MALHVHGIRHRCLPAGACVAPRRGLVQVASLAAAMCTAAVLTACAHREASPSAQLAQLLLNRRIFEPRLYGYASSAPCRATAAAEHLLERTDCSPLPPRGSVEAARLARVTVALRRRALVRGAAGDLHAAGICYLIQAESRQTFERAIEWLEMAAGKQPRDAAVASDLAAAYLVRAERLDAPRDLVAALSRARYAVTLAPRSAEARFNLGLILERLRLRVAAEGAWRAYLALDPRSGWAREANQHLAAVTRITTLEQWPAEQKRLGQAAVAGDMPTVRRVVRRFTQASRLYVWEEVLPDWAELEAGRNQQEARRRLELARSVGEAMAEVAGDTLVAEAAADVAAAYEERLPTRRRRLVAGLREYGRGVRAYALNDLTDSASHFEQATSALGEAASPFQGAAELSRAIASYQRADYVAALDRLRRLNSSPVHRRHRLLRGRAAWIEGLCAAALARPLEGVDAYRRALADFAASGERESEVAVHGLLANSLGMVGEEDLAWRQRFMALSGVAELRSLRRRHALYASAAIAAMRVGEAGAALSFQSEAVAWALQTRNPLDVAEELRARAAIAAELGETQQALADLDEAKASSRQLEERVREAVLGEIEEVEARCWRARDPAQAVRLQRAALDKFRDTAYAGRLAAAYLELARAELATGAAAAATESLRAGIAVQEQEWRRLAQHLDERRPGAPWVAYLDPSRELFDEWISLLVRQGRPAVAFDGSERAHAWELFLQLVEMPALPPGLGTVQDLIPREHLALGEAQRELPAGVTILAYRVLEDRLLCWIVRHDSARLHVLPVRRASLAARIASLHQAIAQQRPRGEVLDLLGDLDAALIAPVRKELRAGEELIFVPDRLVSAVPFAALWNSGPRRFLVEDFATGVAPGVGWYLRALQRDRQLVARSRPSVLVVHSPSLRSDLASGLPALPDAAVEGRGVVALYPVSESIAGAAATRSGVLGAIGRHSVVHFAGHALTVGESPLISAIPLASAGDADSGILYSYELLGRRFRQTRLVVLAACDTAGTMGRRSEKMSGFVRPLLGDGVPAVVGSLWTVEDRATADLFRLFHRRFAAGDDACQALRAAELELLRGGAAPAQWAGFEVFGGSLRARSLIRPPRPAGRSGG
ncbi:MAG TPA: CHAT domain-containing protein [Thermoanaerobaculia bacterium]|jgi:CHAT domain-containing protein|nr:CHAT domain-containing protein [Thermoanaerobaculia bacterium]